MWDGQTYAQIIDVLGVTADLQRVKPPATITAGIKVGFASISKEDQALVNAYGVSGKVITFKAVDVAATPPAKFDTIVCGTERYVIDTVVPVHLPGGVVVGWKAYIKGHV